MEDFRELLREHLQERGALSRLSERSGLSTAVIGRWRDGIGRPTDTNLRKLAPALGHSYEDLAKMCGYLSGEPSNSPDPQWARFIATIEGRWRAMDETTREWAEQTVETIFSVPSNGANAHSGHRANLERQKNRTRSSQGEAGPDKAPSIWWTLLGQHVAPVVTAW